MTMSEVPDPEASRNRLRRAADDAPLRGSREARRGCLALAGPTASGKSAASMAIAQRWPVEIISVDSALVYRGMDIGTAKPTPAEQALVPHHLIDTTDPRDAYSAAEFVRDAQRLIGEIAARGRTPLLVGGTMLYFKALMQGLNDMPPADAVVRAEIEAKALAQGWPALHAALAQIDPATAARLSPNDAQRIQRALEVFAVSGRPLSSFQTGRSDDHVNPIAPGALLSLEPADRAWLHARIAQRFDTMLAEGFVDEVKAPARPRRPAPGPALDALRGLPPGLGGAGRGRRRTADGRAAERTCATAASSPPASWPSARSPGCARCRERRLIVPCDSPDALAQVLRWAESGPLGSPA